MSFSKNIAALLLLSFVSQVSAMQRGDNAFDNLPVYVAGQNLAGQNFDIFAFSDAEKEEIKNGNVLDENGNFDFFSDADIREIEDAHAANPDLFLNQINWDEGVHLTDEEQSQLNRAFWIMNYFRHNN